MDYTPFYEECPPYKKPLIQNQLVLIKGRKFRVDRWFNSDKHCYEFHDLEEEPIKSFCLKPSQCYNLIEKKIMKIIYN